MLRKFFLPVFLLSILCLAGIKAGETRAVHIDDKVAFNTETLKYHCPTCKWAVRCTKNCISVTLEEAKRRGGVACKVCGGLCSR